MYKLSRCFNINQLQSIVKIRSFENQILQETSSLVKALEKDNSNVRVARLSQSEHEYGSFPSFEEIIPMEPSPMLRIPDINVALAPESESELDIYGVQIYEEPIELTEKSDEIDKTPKHSSFQQDDKLNVEIRSQSKEHEANDEHVCKHYTL